MQRVTIIRDHHIFFRPTKYKDHFRNKHQKQISKIDWQRDHLWWFAWGETFLLDKKLQNNWFWRMWWKAIRNEDWQSITYYHKRWPRWWWWIPTYCYEWCWIVYKWSHRSRCTVSICRQKLQQNVQHMLYICCTWVSLRMWMYKNTLYVLHMI